MSGFADFAKAIESRLQTNWTTTPIKFESVPFREMADAYVALFIRDGEGNQISLGTPALRRWPGIVIIQVLVKEDTSTRVARGYADTIAAIFDRVQFSVDGSGTITCATPSIQIIGTRDGYFQLNVTVPYHRDKQY